jgi:translation initiation factor IF-2
LRKKDRSREKALKEERALERRTVVLPGTPMSVGELAEAIDETPVSVIKFLMTDLGVMAAVSQTLDSNTCEAVAEGFGKVVASEDDEDEYDDDEDDDMEDTALESGIAFDEDDPEDLKPRPPVVTIMGHVDHGKTSLLDAIRNTRVTAGEAGGITQAISAYQVEHEGSPITFIDTPGHAAFTDMRERGANTADMIILVVAADDSVKQQTADSIACARQAGVPLLVAVNKIDLDTADPNRVLADLAGYEVLTEDLGGDILCSQISAKEGTNLDDLLSKIMLQAEVLDLKANPDRDAQGVVIEARVEKGLGTVATTLIQRGTIKVGDSFVAGEASGKVRALIGFDGKTRYKEVGPSTPVNVVGINGVPEAGDLMVVAENEQIARELADSRAKIARERKSASYQSGLMESVAGLFSGAQKERREMCVVVKADVQGSAEALARSLTELKLENEEAEVGIKVLISEAGDVTKSDIAVASVTPDTTVIAFNTGANAAAMDDARALGIPIEYYSVVYDAIESVESRMQEVLSPTPEGEYVGSAIVQEVFNIGGTGNIAGSKCRDGIIKKGSNVRVMRGDKILTETKVRTLRNFKAEVDTITTGDECGIGLLDYEDFEAGDIIESYVVTKK